MKAKPPVTNAISVQVTSLGDFPLDPDSGKAWLWTGEGERLLWLSGSARDEVGITGPGPMNPLTDAATFRSFLPLLTLKAPDQEPIRVQQITLTHGPRGGVYTCLCRHVPLRSGGYGLLAVAIGAPARSMAVLQEREPLPPASSPVETPMPVVEPVESVAPLQPVVAPAVADIPTPNVAAPPAAPKPEVSAQGPLLHSHTSSPAWTTINASPERPLRFVWQTDENGRFVHLSRELSEAVGPDNAMVIGQTWDQIVTRYGILEAESVSAGFRSKDTWTGVPALWPVAHSELGVPIEMAGMRMLESSRFVGFRGYGIARIERAIVRPGSAIQALSQDIEPVIERPEERFGPAISRHLPGQGTPADIGTRREEPVTPQSAGQSRDLRRTIAVQNEFDTPSAVSPAVKIQAPDLATFQPGEAHALPAPFTPAVQPSAADEPAVEEPAAGSSLSKVERDAFREIAKTLAGLTPPGQQPPAQPRNSDSSVPTELGRASDTAHKPRPLDLLRQDLIERGGVILNRPPDSTFPEAGRLPGASIITYGEIQKRRGARQEPDPASNAAEIIEKMPICLLVMQEGKAMFANRALLDLAGYPDLETFLTSGGADGLFSDTSGERKDAGRQFTIANRSGDLIAVDASIQAISWDNVPATLTSLRRMQESPHYQQNKVAELELLAARAELQELHSVLETATDGVILLDASGRILNLNRSAEALFGFDQNEIAGESITILLEPESHVAALDYLQGLRSHGVSSLLNDGRDVRGRERNGGVIPLFMTIGRIGEGHGGAANSSMGQGATKFCAVLRDITHWKKVEADLMDAKRAAEDSSAHKTDFLARISHEIRTPLNAIIGFSQVMMSESFGPLGNERYRQYVKDINASGEHIVSLVNDLLDLSKVASGKLELSFGSVDLNALVAACVSMIQPQANAGRVIVRSQLSVSLPPVVADERSVRQILLNLLSNAAKFTEPGGQVVASTSLTERGEVTIRVRDTGIGMTPEDVKRAMEPFRQIPGPRSSGGTGLGLPLTKALVEANRAAFSIHSDSGKGTLVEVTFPSTRVLAE